MPRFAVVIVDYEDMTVWRKYGKSLVVYNCVSILELLATCLEVRQWLKKKNLKKAYCKDDEDRKLLSLGYM